MKLKKKVLVTGGRGMVGSYFSAFKNCVVLGKQELDVTSKKSIEAAVKKHNPDVIVHLAALTDVDLAEKNPELAIKINAEGTKNVALVSKKHSIHLVYVSTGAVFSGKATSRPYVSTDTTAPVNTYAMTKRMGEDIVSSILDTYTIVRTGWVFGGKQRDKKFVGMIARQLWSNTKQIKAVSDTFGCPTYAKDLAAAILQIAEDSVYGVFHGVNKGYASRYQIAKKIVKTLGKDVKVIKASKNDFPSFGAPRPRFEVIEQNVPLRPWQDALEEYLLEWSKERRKKKKTRQSLLLTVDLNATYHKQASRYYQKYVPHKAE